MKTRITPLLVMALLISANVKADNYRWTGAGTAGNWQDANNFYDITAGNTGISYPGATDDVTIPAGSNALIDGSGTGGHTSIHELTISTGATFSMINSSNLQTYGDISANGNIQINNSELNDVGDVTTIDTISLTNSAKLVIDFGAAITNSGTINIDSTSYVVANGNVANTGKIVSVNNTLPEAPDYPGSIYLDAIADGGNSVTISGGGYIDNLVVDNGSSFNTNISMTTGDTLHIKNVLLVVSGGFNTNNRLVLSPNAANTTGIGMIGPVNAGALLTGGVTVAQYIPGGRRAYRFYSHPFTSNLSLSQIENSIDITGNGGAANGFTPTASNSPSAMWFNTVTGNDADANGVSQDPGWTFFTNTTSTTGNNAFKQYEGINFFIRGAKGQGLTGGAYTPLSTVITMYGSAVNTGNQAITLHEGLHNTFNMVGNPYPCAIDIDSALSRTDNLASLGATTYFVWDPYMASQGAFVAQAIDGTHHYLQPNTAFQVEAAYDGAQLQFYEYDKALSIGNDHELLRMANTTAQKQMVQLNVYDAAYQLYDMYYLQLTQQTEKRKQMPASHQTLT